LPGALPLREPESEEMPASRPIWPFGRSREERVTALPDAALVEAARCLLALGWVDVNGHKP